MKSEVKVAFRIPVWLAKKYNVKTEFFGFIKRDTQKAVLVAAFGKMFWLPKSQIKVDLGAGFMTFDEIEGKTKVEKVEDEREVKVEEKKGEQKKNEEILEVPFKVIKKIKHNWGYEEKYLQYGENKKYKAIVKDGKLVAIVSKVYKLIPNELVEQEIKKVYPQVEVRREGWKIYLLEKEFVVGNSVDGSMALTMFLRINIGEGSLVIPSRQVYRRHTKYNDLAKDLTKIISSAKSEIEKYKAWIAKLQNYNVDEEKFKLIADSIPKKYTKGLYYTTKKPTNLKWLFEELIRRIWADRNKLTRKISIYKSLVEAMFIIVEFN